MAGSGTLRLGQRGAGAWSRGRKAVFSLGGQGMCTSFSVRRAAGQDDESMEQQQVRQIHSTNLEKTGDVPRLHEARPMRENACPNLSAGTLSDSALQAVLSLVLHNDHVPPQVVAEGIQHSITVQLRFRPPSPTGQTVCLAQ